MTKETYEKAIELSIKMYELERHIEEIDSGLAKGQKVEFFFDLGRGQKTLYMDRLFPVHPVNFINMYRENVKKKLNRLKRQFARL